MIKTVLSKSWLFGVCVALLLATLVAGVFALWAWLENPGGIFHDATGTNWQFVRDTAASWFEPTFLYTFVVASMLHLATRRLWQTTDKR